MKKKIIICIVLLVVVIAGAIILVGSIGGDREEGTNISDYDKELVEFTWEEFNELKASEQIAFQNSFESFDEFEEWMDDAADKSEDVELPWENGGKAPEEYTWEEFNDLTGPQQIKFQFAFEEDDGFMKWLEQNEPK